MPLVYQIVLFLSFIIIYFLITRWAKDLEHIIVQGFFAIILALSATGIIFNVLGIKYEFSPNSVKAYYETYDKFVEDHAMRELPEFPPVITKTYSQEFLRMCTAYFIWKTNSKLPESYTIPSKCENAFKDISGSARLLNLLCETTYDYDGPISEDRKSAVEYICGPQKQ